MTDHAFFPDDRHAILHTVNAVRDFSEVIFAQSFLAHGERAVVSPGYTQIITEDGKYYSQYYYNKSVLVGPKIKVYTNIFHG